MKQFFSKLGQTFMLPIALLPAAGIMLGVAGSLTSPALVEAFNLENVLGEGKFLYNIFIVLNNAGGIVFSSLPLMFAIAIAIGFAKTEKGAAALAAVMAYLVMNVAISTTLAIFHMTKVDASGVAQLFYFEKTYPGMLSNMLGITNTLSLGVFGGMIAGGATAFLHNRYIGKKLPDFLGFFAGPRLVPIVSSFAALFYGMLLVLVWPPIGMVLSGIGDGLGFLADNGVGFLASLIFGLVERSLIPFGLHHVFYLPLWQSSVGGTYEIGGEAIFGTQAAFFASLKSGDWNAFPSTNFMSGKFPFMMFGLPAAAYAMYKTSDVANRKEVGGLLFSVGLTSFLTGITEPIEFTFLFLAPVLYYGFHVPLAGLSFMLMDLLNVKVGMTFSGGFIDFTFFGMLQYFAGVDNNFYYIILVGLALMPLYYFGFKWYILRYDIATPGRNGAEVKTISKKEYNAAKTSGGNDFIDSIISGLGGAENITDVDACITRLRVSVNDPEKVEGNDFWTKQMGAAGLVKNGKAIQVIYGAKAAEYKTEINTRLGR